MHTFDTNGVQIVPLQSKQLVEDAKTTLESLYPLSNQDVAVHEFGNDGEGTFPTRYDALNRVGVCMELIELAQRFLKTADVMLIQSVAWAKYASNTNNHDQRMHMDYGNNSLGHPSDWSSPEVVAMILYYSDTSETGGGTAYVPRESQDDEWYQTPYNRMPGQGSLPFANDKKQAEDILNAHHIDRSSLYAREVRPRFHVGDVLVYRHDVWHRGTPVKPNHVRYVHNLAYKKRACHWIYTWTNFASKMYYGHIEAFLMTLNMRQLDVIGFPRSKHTQRYLARL